jgi:hypothetical protein
VVPLHLLLHLPQLSPFLLGTLVVRPYWQAFNKLEVSVLSRRSIVRRFVIVAGLRSVVQILAVPLRVQLLGLLVVAVAWLMPLLLRCRRERKRSPRVVSFDTPFSFD